MSSALVNDFFEDGYKMIYPDIAKSKLSPIEHYIKYGKKEGRSNGLVPPKQMFFEDGYVLLYPDVCKSELLPWVHYVKYGKKEGRSNGYVPTSDAFFEEGYKFLYPDVVKSKLSPWIHFVKYGKKEGRSNGVIPPVGKFFEEGYKYLYPNVDYSKMSAWKHYVLCGKKEGKTNGLTPPSDKFFNEGYMFLNPDIDFSMISPWEHYVKFGIKEGRTNGIVPSDDKFYEDGYKFLYADICKSKLSPWEHYVKYGFKEGRSNGVIPPVDRFFSEGYEYLYKDIIDNAETPWKHYVKQGYGLGLSNGLNPPGNVFFKEGYLFLYPDVKKSKKDPWRHFILSGRHEGRCSGVVPPEDVFSKEGYEFLNPDVVDSKSNPWRHYVCYGVNEGRLYNPVIQRKKNRESTNGTKKILLIAHEISLTGAPLSLKSIAKMLMKMGFSVEIWTFPKVVNIYDDLDCDIYSVPNNCKYFSNLSTLLKQFSFVICNTIVTGHYSSFLLNNNIPHLWIIREGEGIFNLMDKLHMDFSLIKQDLENIVVVSEYTQNLVNNKLGVKPNILYNFIEDISTEVKLLDIPASDSRIHFTFCGTLEERKGLDVLVTAFLKLNLLLKDQWCLHIVGDLSDKYKSFWNPLKTMSECYDNIIWHGRLYGDEKWKVFSNTDVFVIPSLDEACSRIVLEGAMLSKTFIATKNVGAIYLGKHNGGLICNTSDCDDLMKVILQCISLGKTKLDAMGRVARKNYLKTSTEVIYEKKLKKVIASKVKFNKISVNCKISTFNYLVPGLKRIDDNYVVLNNFSTLQQNSNAPTDERPVLSDIVSVVIPVFNGLEHLKVLLPSLFKNTDSPHVFYFVNDCSENETISWLKESIKGRPDCVLINNENNMGFPATVNRAVELINTNFVILNTDTQVPKGWLKRLITPIEHDEKIATVTPFSSCATIFSFPIINSDTENKKFAKSVGLDTIDRHCQKFNYSPIDAPVGHGFCMAISYKAWKAVGPLNVLLYGKGYGEEVDFCQRAIIKGYRNVSISNLFVGHWHRGSFSKELKEKQLKKSAPILDYLYPDFRTNVRSFVSEYELRHRCGSIFLSLAAEYLAKNSNHVSVAVSFNEFNSTYDVCAELYNMKYYMTNLSKNDVLSMCNMIGNVRYHNLFLPNDIFLEGLMLNDTGIFPREFANKRRKFYMAVSLVKENIPTGSAYVRCIMPWTNDYIKEHYDISVLTDYKKWFSELCSTDLSGEDICLLQRECLGFDLDELTSFINNWKRHKNYIIYDMDDDFFASELFALKAKISLDDALVVKEKVKLLVSAADVITVSTETLRQNVLKFLEPSKSSKVFVIKNLLDAFLWDVSSKKVVRNNCKTLKIGYVGTRTHLDDMVLIKDAVTDIKNEFGAQVEFEIVGCGRQNEVPWGRVISTGNMSNYHNFAKWLSDVASNWDIALIPLEDNEFNRGKSNLKFLEFSSMKLPIIVSDMSVYSSISKNMKNCLIAENTRESWYLCIKRLINDADLRASLSNCAYREIREHFLIQNNLHFYKKVIDYLLTR